MHDTILTIEKCTDIKQINPKIRVLKIAKKIINTRPLRTYYWMAFNYIGIPCPATSIDSQHTPEPKCC